MAVANAGITDASTLTVGSGVYQDSSVSDPVRVAAATALAPANSDALTFASKKLSSFVDRFADIDVMSLVGAAYNKSGRGGDEYAAFRDQIHMLGSLFFLRADQSKDVTMQALHRKNESIRTYCAVLAALRWPDELLAAGQSGLPDELYANLMALIAVRHPRLSTAASVKLRSDQIASATKRIQDGGLSVFVPTSVLELFANE